MKSKIKLNFHFIKMLNLLTRDFFSNRPKILCKWWNFMNNACINSSAARAAPIRCFKQPPI